jgi:hypothetical protein
MKTKPTILVLAVIALLFSGCAAMQIALEHKDLIVQTQMSETIFLEPSIPENRSIWIEVKNTSDKPLELSGLAGLLAQHGYQIVNTPNKANYRLQINILSVGMCDPSALHQSIYAGWGGTLAGAMAGTAAGFGSHSLSGPFIGGVIGGVAGSAAELIAGSLVKNVTFAIITDVQISEYSKTPVSEQQSSDLKQGTQTIIQQQSSGVSNWKIYRTRVASSANKVNLTFEEAQPVITQNLERVLAGIF